MSKSQLWNYFTKGEQPWQWYKNDRSHRNAWCIACVEQRIRVLQELDNMHVRYGTLGAVRGVDELRKHVLTEMEPICGKSARFLSHLRVCKAISDDDRTVGLLVAQREQSAGRKSNTTPSSHAPPPMVSTSLNQVITPSPKRSRISGPFTKPDLPSPSTLGPEALQHAFSEDLCRLLVATNTAWVAANNPELHTFVRRWVPYPVAVPNRNVLSGRVLESVSKKAEDRVAVKVKGKMATGQCDGWKNVAKSSLVSSVMSVQNEPYLVNTHDVSQDAKTGDNLLKLVLEDLALMESKYGVEVVAWCTDDGPDGKKMRRLLQAQFPWLIALLCWAHQINLIVGDFLGSNCELIQDVSAALEVIKWTNNHGTALELLRQEQTLTFGGLAWALLLPVITRWTAHYLSITRLLKLETPLRICWTRHEDKLIVCAGNRAELREKAQQIRAIVKDDSFWVRLRKIQQLLEPLAIAANVTQASHTRVDHVLLTLGNLFRIYTQAPAGYDSRFCKAIIRSLEKRWAKVDQDIYITAVFLNPFIRARLFLPETLAEADLYTIVERVYERLLRQSASLDFLSAFSDYKNKLEEFTDERMSLEKMRGMFAKENKPLDLHTIWSRVDKGSLQGRNGLVKLAMRLFSVIANSAGCERAFSGFGIIHVAHRNRLDTMKVHRTMTVKLDIIQDHNNMRKKRKFGNDEPSSDPTLTSAASQTDPRASTPSDSTTSGDAGFHLQDPYDFARHAAELVEDALSGSDDVDAAEDPVETAPPSLNSSSTPRRQPKTSIPLAVLFDYAGEPGDGLAFYWKGALKNMEGTGGDVIASNQ